MGQPGCGVFLRPLKGSGQSGLYLPRDAAADAHAGICTSKTLASNRNSTQPLPPSLAPPSLVPWCRGPATAWSPCAWAPAWAPPLCLRPTGHPPRWREASGQLQGLRHQALFLGISASRSPAHHAKHTATKKDKGTALRLHAQAIYKVLFSRIQPLMYVFNLNARQPHDVLLRPVALIPCNPLPQPVCRLRLKPLFAG